MFAIREKAVLFQHDEFASPDRASQREAGTLRKRIQRSLPPGLATAQTGFLHSFTSPFTVPLSARQDAGPGFCVSVKQPRRVYGQAIR